MKSIAAAIPVVFGKKKIPNNSSFFNKIHPLNPKTYEFLLSTAQRLFVNFVEVINLLIEEIMKHPLTYNVLFGCALTCISYTVSAQDMPSHTDANGAQTESRMNNYRTLKNMGYADQAIYEDLGNANFLNKDFETAAFWYKKLKDHSKKGTLSSSYHKRYEFALAQNDTNAASADADTADWMSMIKSDYKVGNRSKATAATASKNQKFRELNFDRESEIRFVEEQLLSDVDSELSEKDRAEAQNLYQAPIALSPDGQTAYFTKPTYIKPEYGVFSKKELVHKIYKAEKVNGRWKNAKEVAVAPKHSSTMHPALSQDGSRLFFASNMPGTFGEYDIYVSTVNKDGSLGVAKNLGRKVNTKKNDMYPNVIEGDALSFASEGHRGQGGLDVYMAEVGRSSVSLAINLGDEINSDGDEFAISFDTRNGKGYVMSNRGGKAAEVEKVAFTYGDGDAKYNDNIFEALNDSQIDYTSSLFED